MDSFAAAKLHVALPAATSLVLTRSFGAPRRAVWNAMTDPALMRQWMVPPPGWSMTACECDARVAGVLRLAWKNQAGDETLALLGVFTEVRAAERLVHTEVMTLSSGEVIGSQLETHEFLDVDGGTQLRITQLFASQEARDSAAPSMQEPMEAGFANLDALLARR
ncbi:MAG: SRPBCC domain-containing protein [Phycisphaerae bacterium]|nr:SRPBCC domain-containing protein [Phycisphaerae bacterium]